MLANRFHIYFLSLFIASRMLIASDSQDIFKQIGEIVKAEKLELQCFVMHVSSEEAPKLLELHEHIVSCMTAVGLKVLYARNGDNNGLPIGTSLQAYMETGVHKSDFLMALYSPSFLKASKNPLSGICTEIEHLRARISSMYDSSNSAEFWDLDFFIPIITFGTPETSIPACLRGLYAAQNELPQGYIQKIILQATSCICYVTEFLKI